MFSRCDTLTEGSQSLFNTLALTHPDSWAQCLTTITPHKVGYGLELPEAQWDYKGESITSPGKLSPENFDRTGSLDRSPPLDNFLDGGGDTKMTGMPLYGSTLEPGQGAPTDTLARGAPGRDADGGEEAAEGAGAVGGLVGDHNEVRGREAPQGGRSICVVGARARTAWGVGDGGLVGKERGGGGASGTPLRHPPFVSHEKNPGGKSPLLPEFGHLPIHAWQGGGGGICMGCAIPGHGPLRSRHRCSAAERSLGAREGRNSQGGGGCWTVSF